MTYIVETFDFVIALLFFAVFWNIPVLSRLSFGQFIIWYGGVPKELELQIGESNSHLEINIIKEVTLFQNLINLII